MERQLLGLETCMEDCVSNPNYLICVKVYDLVDEHGEWKWDTLQSWIPQDLLDKIRVCMPPSLEHKHVIFILEVQVIAFFP